MEEQGTMRIYRPSSLISWSFNYNVLIDGELVGGIGPRETKALQVAPGKHRVRVKMIGRKSQERTVTLRPGDDQTLVVATSWMAGDVRLEPATPKELAKSKSARQTRC